MRKLRLLVACAAVTACAPNVSVLQPVPSWATPQVALCDGGVACSDSVELTYLGKGGYMLRHRGQALLAGPTFTQRGMLKVLLTRPYHFRTDTALVDERMRQMDTSGIRAILIGHSHYDHMLDVPYLVRRWAPRANIYGSPTMANILHGDTVTRALAMNVASSVRTDSTEGAWVYAEGGRFRFMPLASWHPPNLLGYTFANAETLRQRESLPRTARGWHKGQVYAWIIDVIRPDSTPVFRMYYQDSAADSVHLTLPRFRLARDHHRIDVALLCAGNFDEVPNNPDVTLDALAPKFAVLGHWEDFFRAARDPLRAIRLTDTEHLAHRMNVRMGRRWLTPEPMTRVTFRY